jgi:hypothetical protein
MALETLETSLLHFAPHIDLKLGAVVRPRRCLGGAVRF